MQLPLPDLLLQSIYSCLAGYAGLNDAERLSQDPTFRLIGSEKIWEPGGALFPWFETEALGQAENLYGMSRINRGADFESGGHGFIPAGRTGYGRRRIAGSCMTQCRF